MSWYTKDMSHVIDLRKQKEEQEAEEAAKERSKETVADIAVGVPVFVPEKETIPFQRPKLIVRPTFLEWIGPAYPLPLRSIAPTIAAFVLWGVGALLVYLTHDAVTGVLFGMLGIMILIASRRSVPEVMVQINADMIRVGDAAHSVHHIKSFWVDYEPELGIKELSLRFKQWYRPYVKIPLADQSPVQVRSILIQSVPEEPHEETVVEAIARRLGL